MKKFSLEAFINGEWVSLKDALVNNGDGLTTIGHRRIICFPTITTTKLRFTILDAKACPLSSRIGIYMAPDINQKKPQARKEQASSYSILQPTDRTLLINLNQEATVTGFSYFPPQDTRDGVITHYRISATTDQKHWETIGEGEFSNIANNPIWQTIRCKPTRAITIRLEGLRLVQGERIGYSDIEVITAEKK